MIEKILDINNLSFENKFNSDKWSVVVNCGENIMLPDGSILARFSSGLYKNIEIKGEKFLVFEVGGLSEVSDEMADFCRKNWTPVYDIFPSDIFKEADFFRSPKIKLESLEFNFWYCGENFSCGIHNKHDFFELHTQIFGQGEMQKFQSDEEKSIYQRVVLSPGNTHDPFYDSEMTYPFHQYRSISKCVWLAIESPKIFPVINKQ